MFRKFFFIRERFEELELLKAKYWTLSYCGPEQDSRFIDSLEKKCFSCSMNESRLQPFASSLSFSNIELICRQCGWRFYANRRFWDFGWIRYFHLDLLFQFSVQYPLLDCVRMLMRRGIENEFLLVWNDFERPVWVYFKSCRGNCNRRFTLLIKHRFKWPSDFLSNALFGNIDNSLTRYWLRLYLRGIPELVAHDVVQERIDARRQKVRDAGNVSQSNVDPHEEIVAAEGLVSHLPVNCHDALSVKRRPAQEERYGNSD